MSRKINILIAFAAVVTLLLAAINIYLVETAYNYKVQEFRNEVKDKITQITSNSSGLDSAFFHKKDVLYRNLAEDYMEDKKIGIRIRDKVVSNEYQSELARKLQLQIQKEFPELKMNFAIVIDKFVIYKGATPDTVYSYNKASLRNRIIGNMASLDDAFAVRNYVGTTSGLAGKTNYSLLTEDTLYLTIHDWKHVIMQRMILILLLSFLSITTVITLFVIALKALIKQKKISDVKTDFINNITHELKTPLTTLSVSTRILEDRTIIYDDDAYNTILQTINRQNNRLHNLIDQVLSNALGFDEDALKKESTDAHQFLSSVVEDFCLGNPDVEVITDFSAANTTLAMDKFHLTTAIVNVLENAVKYGSKNIVISTQSSANRFTIGIKDDGIGIAKNKQPLLFDKFYRIDNTNVHDVKGLGLGLYYVKQIITAHRGKINVVSDTGMGSLFNIFLPTAA